MVRKQPLKEANEKNNEWETMSQVLLFLIRKMLQRGNCEVITSHRPSSPAGRLGEKWKRENVERNIVFPTSIPPRALSPPAI